MSPAVGWRERLAARLPAGGAINQPFVPSQSEAQVGHFIWIRFAGFQHGSLRYIAEFLQRAFQLGGMIWLLDRVGCVRGLPPLSSPSGSSSPSWRRAVCRWRSEST
jgi:hypothetical protein